MSNGDFTVFFFPAKMAKRCRNATTDKDATTDKGTDEDVHKYIFVNVVSIHEDVPDKPSFSHYMLHGTEPLFPVLSNAITLEPIVHALYSAESFFQTEFDLVYNADTKIEWEPWKFGTNSGDFADEDDADRVLNDGDTLEHMLIMYCGGWMVDKQPDLPPSRCRTLTIFNITKSH